MKQNNPVCFKFSVLLFRGCKKSVSAVIPGTGIACAIPARTSVKFKPGKFCFQICGKIVRWPGISAKGSIAYEEVLVLAGKMTVVEFCGG